MWYTSRVKGKALGGLLTHVNSRAPIGRLLARIHVLLLLLPTIFGLRAQQPIWLEHFGSTSSGSRSFMLSGYEHHALYAFGAFAGPPMVIGPYTIVHAGDRDVMLVKLDTAGNVLWVRTAGGSCQYDEDRRKSVAVAPSGERVVITGNHNCGVIWFDDISVDGSGTTDPRDAFIAAYDSAGTVLWAHSAEGFDVQPGEVLLDADHNTFWFGGVVTMSAVFNGDVPIVVQPGGFVAKYAANGDLLFAERWLTNGTIEDADRYGSDQWVLCGRARAGAQLNGQSLGVTSTTQNGWIARVDTAGSTVWAVPILSDLNTYAYRCAPGPNGDVVTLGGFQGNVILENDTLVGSGASYYNFLASYSSGGQLNWAQRLGGGDHFAAFDMECAPNGDIYVLGEFENELVLPGVAPLTAGTALDMFVARFDPATGLCRSAYHYGKVGSINVQSYGSLWPTANGLYVADCYDSTFTMGTHVLEPSGPVATDIFIAKFDSLSGFTGIQTMPLQEGALHIYANPNKGTCTIDLPTQLRLSDGLMLSIFDQAGHLVQRMPLRYTSERVAIDIRAQAKGIYHVELGDGQQRYTGRIVFE